MVDEESEKAQNLHVLGESYFWSSTSLGWSVYSAFRFHSRKVKPGKENLDTLIEIFVISLLIPLWSTIEKNS